MLFSLFSDVFHATLPKPPPFSYLLLLFSSLFSYWQVTHLLGIFKVFGAFIHSPVTSHSWEEGDPPPYSWTEAGFNKSLVMTHIIRVVELKFRPGVQQVCPAFIFHFLPALSLSNTYSQFLYGFPLLGKRVSLISSTGTLILWWFYFLKQLCSWPFTLLSRSFKISFFFLNSHVFRVLPALCTTSESCAHPGR